MGLYTGGTKCSQCGTSLIEGDTLDCVGCHMDSLRSSKPKLQSDRINGVGTGNAKLLGAAYEDIEADPYGKDPHKSGAKLDAGKVPIEEILEQFAKALWSVAEVGAFGAEKYTMGGWLDVPNGEVRYKNAGARHRLKRAMGEEVDPDSGKLHLAQEAWNKLAELELHLRSKENA
tara:strand:+ start:278 stop:799 length:522 start_codon:yes stop_codon:yes gene_type:complete